MDVLYLILRYAAIEKIDRNADGLIEVEVVPHPFTRHRPVIITGTGEDLAAILDAIWNQHFAGEVGLEVKAA